MPLRLPGLCLGLGPFPGPSWGRTLFPLVFLFWYPLPTRLSGLGTWAPDSCPSSPCSRHTGQPACGFLGTSISPIPFPGSGTQLSCWNALSSLLVRQSSAKGRLIWGALSDVRAEDHLAPADGTSCSSLGLLLQSGRARERHTGPGTTDSSLVSAEGRRAWAARAFLKKA